jgi:hypothetical protein
MTYGLLALSLNFILKHKIKPEPGFLSSCALFLQLNHRTLDVFPNTYLLNK